MRVVVENLTGTLFHIQVDNDAKVGDLKREIEAQHNLPCDRMILIPDSNPRYLIMNDDGDDQFSLVDFGVHDGSHIYIFFNPLDDGSTDRSSFTFPGSLLG